MRYKIFSRPRRKVTGLRAAGTWQADWLAKMTGIVLLVALPAFLIMLWWLTGGQDTVHALFTGGTTNFMDWFWLFWVMIVAGLAVSNVSNIIKQK